MSDANTPPPFTGPGSPQDVPPRPGELGVDPHTSPAADPRPTAEAGSGRHRHGVGRPEGRRQSLSEMRRDRHPAEARNRPAHLRLVPQRVAWRARRGGVRPGRRARYARGHDHRLGRARYRCRRSRAAHVQLQRLRRRGDDQHRERDDGALPLVPPRVRRQRAGARTAPCRTPCCPSTSRRTTRWHASASSSTNAGSSRSRRSRKSSRPRTSSPSTCRT